MIKGWYAFSVSGKIGDGYLDNARHHRLYQPSVIIRGHGNRLEEVILIAHESCGWYKEILGIDTQPEVLGERETNDLRESLIMLPILLSQRKVSARTFYAEGTSENYIRFVPVLL